MTDSQKTTLIQVLLFSALSFLIVAALENRALFNLEREAINLGFAEYNPTNGTWQWKSPK